jgi:hypothetical protein
VPEEEKGVEAAPEEGEGTAPAVPAPPVAFAEAAAPVVVEEAVPPVVVEEAAPVPPRRHGRAMPV